MQQILEFEIQNLKAKVDKEQQAIRIEREKNVQLEGINTLQQQHIGELYSAIADKDREVVNWVQAVDCWNQMYVALEKEHKQLNLTGQELRNQNDRQIIEREHLRSDLEQLRQDNEQQRVMIDNQIPMIVCSVGLGMVSAFGMLLIWLFCRHKKNQRKDPECKDRTVQEKAGSLVVDLLVERSIPLEKEHASDDGYIHDHIMVIADGQHMTAGCTEEAIKQDSPATDWREKRQQEESA